MNNTNKGIIYCYKVNGTIKYIGQTKNLSARHSQHIKTDPYNKAIHEYNYPLSRAVRKYGEAAIELIVLEDNVAIGDLDMREQYYIKLYDTHKNGYNQTIGGATWGYSSYPQSLIRDVKQQLQNGISHKEIKLQTGLSYTHIFNIDNGIRCAEDGEIYPLSGNIHPKCGGKLNNQAVLEIVELLLNSCLSQEAIALKYGITQSGVSRINLGKRVNIPNKDSYSFPLRK